MSAWKRHARRARTRVRVVSRDGASSVDAWISAAWRGGQGRRDKFPCHVSSDLKPRLRLRFPLGSRIVTWSPPLATIFRCCFGKRESSIPLSTRGAKKEDARQSSSPSRRSLTLACPPPPSSPPLRFPLVLSASLSSSATNRRAWSTTRTPDALLARFLAATAGARTLYGTLPRKRIANLPRGTALSTGLRRFRALAPVSVRAVRRLARGHRV